MICLYYTIGMINSDAMKRLRNRNLDYGGVTAYMGLEVRPIDDGELRELLSIYRDISRTLESRGLPMWDRTYLRNPSVFRERYDDPECFGLCDCGTIIGGFILTTAEQPFWQLEEGIRYLFVHKLGVAVPCWGKGYGDLLLQWIICEAARRGYDVLALDCYADREALMRLYANNGFTLKHRFFTEDGQPIAQFIHPLVNPGLLP